MIPVIYATRKVLVKDRQVNQVKSSKSRYDSLKPTKQQISKCKISATSEKNQLILDGKINVYGFKVLKVNGKKSYVKRFETIAGQETWLRKNGQKSWNRKNGQKSWLRKNGQKSWLRKNGQKFFCNLEIDKQ